jgi:hypothetical protein
MGPPRPEVHIRWGEKGIADDTWEREFTYPFFSSRELHGDITPMGG